jgi:SAM-dependent methyltransferase
VLSNFGVIYAARPAVAASEILRVLSPGGRALFTAYPADSFNAQALGLTDRYLPSESGQPLVDEHQWAEPGPLRAWFPDCAVEVERRSQAGETFASAEAWWQSIQEVPIAKRMHDALPTDRFAELGREIVALRSRYARFGEDGSMTPVNDYVVCRIDPLTRR